MWDGDLSFINKVLMDSDNADLCGDVSADEIEEVVKTMPWDKAPGPDGIPAEFCISCWDRVKADFIEVVMYFFNTFIALIP